VAFIEPVPRIRMLKPAPGCPLLEFTVRPVVAPCKACSKDVTGTSFNTFSAFTDEAAPVKDDFLAVPYATTITSSSIWLSAANTTCNVGLMPIS